jgi:hypothetical protein
MPASVYLSNDARLCSLAFQDGPVMQMRVGWTLATAGGLKFQDTAYFTPYELPKFSAAGGRIWRDNRRPDTASCVGESRCTGQRRGRPTAVSGIRVYRVPRDR